MHTFYLVLFWLVVILIAPQKIVLFIQKHFLKQEEKSEAIGSIFAVQSKNMFLVSVYEDKSISKFSEVIFRHSVNGKEIFLIGLVFDVYFLNKKKWVRALSLRNLTPAEQENFPCKKYKEDIVYCNEFADTVTISEEINSFMGVVGKGSAIGTIKFLYSQKDNDIQEGDLLKLKIGDKPLFYQVIGGITEIEKLEDKNETGFIEGEAIQLGEWKQDKLSFQKFGWLPEVNTPIFKANTEAITPPEPTYPDFKLGVIPNTNLPSVVDLNEAVSHHMALIGVTGSGKSFLAREIIQEILIDTKVICVDFTGEWKKKLKERSVQFEILNKVNINTFFDGASKLGILELPVMSNTVDVINATESLLSKIFDFAKDAYERNSPQKICLILEEAHTIVPEAQFLGVNNWDSKAVVNKMGQIALQGRKYGVGLMVIAQRTANVSKTVLTQCNTVVCFQAFDETSFNFLGNYVGKDLVKALPNLKQYHAIVTGKAVRSNIPMIVDLDRRKKKH